MSYILGLDIGTSSAKALLVDEAGSQLFSGDETYSTSHPELDRSEQDPQEVFAAVLKLISLALPFVKNNARILISFSAAMHSLIAVDADGNLISSCWIWSDNRAINEARKLHDRGLAKKIYDTTGVPVHPMSPLCKILWMRKHQQEIFVRATKFLGIKEYIVWRLTGESLTDSSLASATGMMNIDTLKWDEHILNLLEIEESRLPLIVPATYKTASVHLAKALEAFSGIVLNSEVLIMIGASDGCLAALAAGDDAVTLTIGTSAAVRVMHRSPRLDPEMRTFCYHLVDDIFVSGGASNNGGVVLEWLRSNILCTQQTIDELIKEAMTAPKGCDGLRFIPHILGERAPIWNAAATGSWQGLKQTHTRAHLIRACLEGIIENLFEIYKSLDVPASTPIIASGGFTRSPEWVQITSERFGKKLIISEESSSVFGAIKLAF